MVVRGLARGHTVGFAVQAACLPTTISVRYAVHTLLLGADGTSWWGAPCPAGTAPVGGGAAVADPRAEQVVQAGFHTSALTRRIDGYQATVQVRGLARGHTVGFAVQVACVPATIFVFYAVHTVLLGADGTSWWGAPCPAGATPVGGGTAVANPPIENVAQAGFTAPPEGSMATRPPCGSAACPAGCSSRSRCKLPASRLRPRQPTALRAR